MRLKPLGHIGLYVLFFYCNTPRYFTFPSSDLPVFKPPEVNVLIVILNCSNASGYGQDDFPMIASLEDLVATFYLCSVWKYCWTKFSLMDKNCFLNGKAIIFKVSSVEAFEHLVNYRSRNRKFRSESGSKFWAPYSWIQIGLIMS